MKIVKAFNKQGNCFYIGGKKLPITALDCKLIFGICDGRSEMSVCSEKDERSQQHDL